jgi:hypothetical protein
LESISGYTVLMRTVFCAVTLLICSFLGGQSTSTFDLPGTLELVDRPPQATPVEAMLVTLHPLKLDYEIHAQPDRDGKFILKNVRPERYSLTLHSPGRIRTFAIGSKDLAPDGFELNSTDEGSLRIIVSLKSSILLVEALGLPKVGSFIVLLVPADPYLSLRESCFSNALTDPRTKFSYVPPGKYRLFLADSKYGSDLAGYAPRFPEFLKDHSTQVEVAEEGETKATVTYVDGETIEEAIREAGPIH